MARIVVAAIAVAVLAGCGSAGGPFAGAGSCFPPRPEIKPRRTEHRIRVAYRVPSRGGCEKLAIHITANSVDKLDNIAPGKGGGGPVEFDGTEGEIVLNEPPLDLPPYEAKASTVNRFGRRSETVVVRIPDRGVYCRQTQSAAVCIKRAQAKFMRCLRGRAPRNTCPDYVWNARPLIPYVPLKGITRREVERSFAYTAKRAGSYFISVHCSSVRWCVGRWREYWGEMRARYEVSGYGAEPGCWIAERRAILSEAQPPRNMAPLRHVISDRIGSCVQWVR